MGRPLLRIYDGFDHTRPDLADEVRELQDILNQSGQGLEVDGRFGRETEMAVRRYQREQGLNDDGIVGMVTWTSLLGVPAPDPADAFTTTLPRNHGALLAQLAVAESFRVHIVEGANVCGVSSAVVCGIGSRESGWGLALTPAGPAGTGDSVPRSRAKPWRPGPLPPDGGGFGRGVMQIDYDAHAFARTGAWRDPRENILYGCRVLGGCLKIVRRRTGLHDSAALRAAVAAYNCGPGNVLRALQQGRDVDFFTVRRDYSSDVLDRTGWFRIHGWD